MKTDRPRRKKTHYANFMRPEFISSSIKGAIILNVGLSRKLSIEFQFNLEKNAKAKPTKRELQEIGNLYESFFFFFDILL